MIDKEKLKERLHQANLKLLERARNLVRTTTEEEDEPSKSTRSLGPSKKVGQKSKLMDTYRMESHYNFRSSSFVDRREQAVQTKIDTQQVVSRKATVIGQGGPALKGLSGFQGALLLSLGGRTRDSKGKEKSNDATGSVFFPEEKKVNIIELENEKRQRILTSQTFNEYFSEASKFVEKIIGQEDDGQIITGQKKGKSGRPCVEVESEFMIDAPLSFKTGTINHLAWSPLIQECFLTVYSEPIEGNVYDKMLIWNVNFKHRPEFELNSNSKIQQAIFSPFNTEIIVAGMESGRIYVYDLRAKKEPVMKSGISQDSHRTQITGMQFIGTNNSSNLVSISEEGRMCIWPIAKFDTPRKVDLLYQEKKDNVEDYQFPSEPLCISSVPGDISSVFIGCSDSRVYQCVTESTQLDQAPKYFTQVFSEHSAVVSSVHMSPLNANATELSGLMLTGSLDWTTKLWNPKSQKALATFELQKDAVSDVHWNHAETGLFATAGVDGMVAVYDLLADFENPRLTFDFGECVLNAKWDGTGKLLAITDSQGRVNVKKFTNNAFVHTQADMENLETMLKYQVR